MFSQTSPVPQWIADLRARKMLDANDAALKFWRMTREQFLTMPVEEFFHPEEVTRWQQYIEKDSWGESGPWKCCRGDGSTFYCWTRWHMTTYNGVHCAFVFPTRAGESTQNMMELRQYQERARSTSQAR